MKVNLNENWYILQDVHDTAEQLGLYREDFGSNTAISNQMSEWESLPELRHLQLVFAENPYWGRELRYFNQAPWWYRRIIHVDNAQGKRIQLTFTNVDYYCRVWLNGILLGEHEGYSDPFSFDVTKLLHDGDNVLVVKVWSPWDNEVDDNRQQERTFLIKRNMVKGTYEHSDGFIQRDVNPIGIYGEVFLTLHEDAFFSREPRLTYTLCPEECRVTLKLECSIENLSGAQEQYRVHLRCCDSQTGEIKLERDYGVSDNIEETLSDIRLWNTWDRGGAWLYDITTSLCRNGQVVDQATRKYGFRKVELERTPEKTMFLLNGKRFYIRGTSYYPDAYVSNMCVERYKRDLAAMKRLGFNTLRVHVHVEMPVFYELCDSYGIGIIQDSEYNWMHPVTDAFCSRFIQIYLRNVEMLMPYSSILSWICMNEPGLRDPAGRQNSRAMTVNPGPALYAKITEIDPSRPAIKGSFCQDDPFSGDSHNYSGALWHQTSYVDIDGTTEKLNTEFGVDAIPCLYSLKKCPPLYGRLRSITDRIDDIQKYQYMLLKYFISHYRAQRFCPNSGYMQFLFSDMCPQSFYGVYDWWGLPKQGVRALEEVNQPVAVFLHYGKEKIYSICVVNDTDTDYGKVTVKLVFNAKRAGQRVYSFDGVLHGDGFLAFAADALEYDASDVIDATLTLYKDQNVLAHNRNENLFFFPNPPEGYPGRISHELGMRIFNA